MTDAKSPDQDWLETYYYLRFAVSAIWVALAFTVAKAMPSLAAVMLVAIPRGTRWRTISTPAGAAAWRVTRARC